MPTKDNPMLHLLLNATSAELAEMGEHLVQLAAIEPEQRKAIARMLLAAEESFATISRT